MSAEVPGSGLICDSFELNQRASILFTLFTFRLPHLSFLHSEICNLCLSIQVDLT